jgi:preprotein translocase subunit SecA
MGQHEDPADWQLEHFGQQMMEFFGTTPEQENLVVQDLSLPEIGDRLWERLEALYREKEDKVGPDMMRRYERNIMLQIIDRAWKDHLLAMDHLKDGIGLRAYGQRDPLVEYKRESFDMFGQMKERIENDIVRFLFRLQPMTEEEQRAEAERRRQEQERIFRAASASASGVTARGGVTTVQRKSAKVGRNDPCPCGSGKKYKKCHGAA